MTEEDLKPERISSKFSKDDINYLVHFKRVKTMFGDKMTSMVEAYLDEGEGVTRHLAHGKTKEDAMKLAVYGLRALESSKISDPWVRAVMERYDMKLEEAEELLLHATEYNVNNMAEVFEVIEEEILPEYAYNLGPNSKVKYKRGRK